MLLADLWLCGLCANVWNCVGQQFPAKWCAEWVLPSRPDTLTLPLSSMEVKNWTEITMCHFSSNLCHWACIYAIYGVYLGKHHYYDYSYLGLVIWSPKPKGRNKPFYTINPNGSVQAEERFHLHFHLDMVKVLCNSVPTIKLGSYLMQAHFLSNWMGKYKNLIFLFNICVSVPFLFCVPSLVSWLLKG